MKIKNIFVLTNAGLALLLLSACGVLTPAISPTASVPTIAVQPATGLEYRFVTDKLLLPTTMMQSQEFALNIDNDLQGHNDNLFGTLLSLLTSAAPSLKLQSTLDQAVETGEVVTLHVVKEDAALNDSSVSWNVLLGEKTQTAPKFDGSGNFKVDSNIPANLPILGSLTNGHFAGGPGSARIQIFLLDQMVDVKLIGVHLEADFSEKGCTNGKIGGGITVEDFQDTLVPAIAAGLNQVIKVDESLSKTLLQAFDSDQNGEITSQEIENNPLMMIAASPDLDLLDASGKFNPGQDGVKDSYSAGLGFTCIAASFTVPGE